MTVFFADSRYGHVDVNDAQFAALTASGRLSNQPFEVPVGVPGAAPVVKDHWVFDGTLAEFRAILGGGMVGVPLDEPPAPPAVEEEKSEPEVPDLAALVLENNQMLHTLLGRIPAPAPVKTPGGPWAKR